jgi:dTDP-4-dehydrorhamnose 3,5-epimerase
VTPFRAEPTRIDGLWTTQLKQASDSRGTVREAYRESEFAATGLPSLGARPQTNATETRKGGLRGIHGELAHKLVGVVAGRVYAVILDLRPASPTAGEWLDFTLGPGDGLFVSSGLGNSFQSISDEPSQYLYLFAEEWVPGMPGVHVTPLDPALGIEWPLEPILSEKDADPTKTLAAALGPPSG